MFLNKLIISLLVFSFLGCETVRKEDNQTKNTTIPPASKTETTVAVGLKIGQQAPDISLPDLNGQIKTLSSLRGKVILVDFWASWCGPCRYENPNVVRLYQKYKEADFDILSVSLDDNKKAWMNAIEADGMEWNHVSDLMKWESTVIPVYQIDGIPMTYLLDKNGIIIAKNLRGAELATKLAEVVAKK